MTLLFSFPGTSEIGIIVLVLVAAIFWIKMILEIATSSFANKESKIMWLLITIFLGFIGALIYFFVGRNSRTSLTDS
ncbi:MAG: PLDc N-terminal domain-containing protein [Gloeobacteraceae cyanobacterium ES-bin-316]|nr:PLDc N-terminal domain-containing protein [Ferruginibacter sp.]